VGIAYITDLTRIDSPGTAVRITIAIEDPYPAVGMVVSALNHGTARVGEFLDKGFTFISIGNDLHHVLTQAGAYVVDVERIAKEKGKTWKRRPTALF